MCPDDRERLKNKNDMILVFLELNHTGDSGPLESKAFHGGSITAAPVLSALQNVTGHRTWAVVQF